MIRVLSICAIFLLSACGGDDGTTDPPAPEPAADCPDNSWPPCSGEVDDRPRGILPGDVVVDLVGVDQFGDLVELRQFRGKPLVLSVGATWCGPCRDDAANYAAVHTYLMEAFPGSGDAPFWFVEILTDARDQTGSLPAQTGWAQVYGMEGPVLGGAGAARAGARLQISSIPTKLVIDGEGVIVGRLSGSGQWGDIRTWLVEADRRRVDARAAR